MSQRLFPQIKFLLEADKLKEVQRRSYLVSQQRKENSAEHSWHLTLLALVLGEYSNETIDTLKVLRMLIIHDLVEIDAGDFSLYDSALLEAKSQSEERAAKRIFGLLPTDQMEEFMNLWKEFEARQSKEAKFAAALDRLMPLLHNLNTAGRTWKEHGVTAPQVLTRNQPIAEGSKLLWEWMKEELLRAVETGTLDSP